MFFWDVSDHQKHGRRCLESLDKTYYLCDLDKPEGLEMARVVIEGFPDELYHELKIKAATEKTSVKALLIAAAEKSLARDTSRS